jgi:hypothetical protein
LVDFDTLHVSTLDQKKQLVGKNFSDKKAVNLKFGRESPGDTDFWHDLDQEKQPSEEKQES